MHVPHILLINPWIHDFAAYDFWAAPLGLLSLAGILRQHGLGVSYIDCLDRFHPRAPETDPRKRHGRGPYRKTPISPPEPLREIPRRFSRYGIDPEWFRKDLGALDEPDLILVTSLMTYWYPGVQETIRTIRAVFPEVPVLLGGIYARLCTDHAVRTAGADRVVTGDGTARILDLVAEHTGYRVEPQFNPGDPDTFPSPALDLQHRIPFVPLLTSRGCPFRCDYCASGFLDPDRMRRSPEQVVSEIRYWHEEHGAEDFVFYDDALLVQAEEHAIPMFEAVIREGLRVQFHTPNAVHVRAIAERTADLMRTAGFHTLRLGLETAAFEPENRKDRKVTEAEFIRATAALRKAGFSPNQVGAYLLAGLPDQTVTALEASIDTVLASGVTPVLAHYTPIPHTPLWEKAVAVSRFDLTADPIFTNNALFPCWPRFSWDVMSRLKERIAKGKTG